MNFRIERWTGQPGVAETLAAWHVREWAGLFAGWDETVAQSEFHAQLRHSGLPATWLAYGEEGLIGSISALLEDSPEMADVPGPWLASFYIVPEARGQGVAQALMTAAAQAVAALGYPGWYLFTENHEDYYANAGWLLHERRQLHGQTVAVMWQDLTGDAGA
ncbi:MAG: GNAT family N-acetyltransferase [Arenimonas sp.]|uniref:GNAT family N-acetyltransferase n=1 Tax=Arenimonas sp. TaxID=1872635 RepID=UPI003C06179F